MSIRLYVGNLPKEVERQELQDFFADAGEGVSVKVITDRKTGKCRGFGFVTVKNDAQADELIEKYNGNSFKENALKIEKAMPRSKGKNEKGEDAPAAPTKSNRGKNSGSRSRGTSDSSSPASTGPDPRWATELEKLKEMLATQTTNS
ncbi:MAG: RNA-binding protein [Cyanobacteriota bacterium]|nr:RNA-binding protein [Cyanobacteriota bacterium]